MILVGRIRTNSIKIEQRFLSTRFVHSNSDCDDLVTRVVDFVETLSHDLPFAVRCETHCISTTGLEIITRNPCWPDDHLDQCRLQDRCTKAIRAVVNAYSVNNIAFALRWHRVLQKNGSLSGYHEEKRAPACSDAREAEAESRARPRQSARPKSRYGHHPRSGMLQKFPPEWYPRTKSYNCSRQLWQNLWIVVMRFFGSR